MIYELNNSLFNRTTWQKSHNETKRFSQESEQIRAALLTIGETLILPGFKISFYPIAAYVGSLIRGGDYGSRQKHIGDVKLAKRLYPYYKKRQTYEKCYTPTHPPPENAKTYACRSLRGNPSNSWRKSNRVDNLTIINRKTFTIARACAASHVSGSSAATSTAKSPRNRGGELSYYCDLRQFVISILPSFLGELHFRRCMRYSVRE